MKSQNMQWQGKVQNLCKNITAQDLHCVDMEGISAKFNIHDRLHRTRNVSTRTITLYQSSVNILVSTPYAIRNGRQ
jgi:hypothetical protein